MFLHNSTNCSEIVKNCSNITSWAESALCVGLNLQMNQGKRSCWPKVLDQVSHVCGLRGVEVSATVIKAERWWRRVHEPIRGNHICLSSVCCVVLVVQCRNMSPSSVRRHLPERSSCLSVCDAPAPPAVSERAAVSPPLLLCPLGSVSGVHLWRLNFRTASPGAPLPYVLHSLPPRRGQPPPLLLLQPLPPDPGKPPPLTFPSRWVVFLVLLYYFTCPSFFTPIWSTTCSDFKWFALW